MSLGAEKRKTRTLHAAGPLSPANEVIRIRSSMYPVEEAAYTRSRGVDWVVFGITAVIAVGFLVWGFVSTASLANASGSALDVGHGQHGLVVRADRVGVCGFRTLACARPIRHDPAGPRRRRARVQRRLLDRHDVLRRHGHRSDVLRRRRAADALHHPAPWHRRGGKSGGGPECVGDHAVSLDSAPVGDLRGRRACDRLRRVPQGPATAGQRGIRATAGLPA